MGRFEYVKISRLEILSWVREFCKLLLKSILKVVMLINGWVLFQFFSVEDKVIIESQYWILGLDPLVLGRWFVGFDPGSARVVHCHHWVIFLDFPIQCWNLKSFMVVANAIGSFMFIEDDQLLGFDCSTPRIMVDMDLSEGLPNELEVLWDGSYYTHKLNY